jgi:hypothetical protein
MAVPLAGDEDLSRPPVDVVDAERRHLVGAQAQAVQHDQDRVVHVQESEERPQRDHHVLE